MCRIPRLLKEPARRQRAATCVRDCWDGNTEHFYLAERIALFIQYENASPLFEGSRR